MFYFSIHKDYLTYYETVGYGSRCSDLGPASMYGAFARSNMNTPGYRINFSPRSDIQSSISHRAFWLAESKDSWTAAGLLDKAGKSSDFIGQQLELMSRWDVNSSLNLETGWTHLFKGQFAQYAPKAPNNQDVDYFYLQSQLRF